MISSVLIANRGEIAVRITRSARQLGIRSIAVYTEVDADALHVRLADEAYRLESSYLNAEELIAVAQRAGAEAIHPGYGFLSENSDFARAVIDAGIRWVGPPPEAIEKLGDKVSARAVAESVGAPLAPGTPDPIESWEEARDFAEEHGLPIAIKAAYGGGGRGLKVVDKAEEIEQSFHSAQREAVEAFGRGECFVEKFLTRPRHVEAQVLADSFGNVRVLGTRDCSVQRRYQKLIEEAPAPFLSAEQEESIIEGARAICAQVGYESAGTVEFIVAEDGTVSFLEVNTRIQVEHPVTEAVTGVDIVAEQLRVASGLPLSFDTDPKLHGHAIELRINAEDVAHGFVPNPGTITHFAAPTGPGVRTDSGVETGSEIPGNYDSLIAKVIVNAPDRDAAILRARDAAKEMRISGVRTVLPFHLDILEHPAFAGDELKVYTNWVDREYTPGEATGVDIEDSYTERTRLTIDIDGKRHEIGIPAALLQLGSGPAPAAQASEEVDGVNAPLTGSLVSWQVNDGDAVEEGQIVAVVEAMKMETNVTAPYAGVIETEVQPGAAIKRGQRLAQLKA